VVRPAGTPAARDVVRLVRVHLWPAGSGAGPVARRADRGEGSPPAAARRAPRHGHWRRSGAWRAGSLAHRPPDGASRPPGRDPSDSARSLRPPFCRPAGRVETGPRPIDLAGIAQALEQDALEAGPDAAWCQSRRRRQQVLPLPHPSSARRSDHGQPLRRMKSMPASAFRSGVRGRPPRAWDGGGGSRGATTAHSSSGTIQAMLSLPQPRVVPS
jgi:hypothetical protein